jgi:hypothetical protein
MELTWDVKVLRTAAEQSLGVKQFLFPLPTNYLLFFPGVRPGTYVNMVNVKEPLHIYFLDAGLTVVGSGTLRLGEVAPVPPNAEHLVEISSQAQPPQEFGFLAQYI